MQGTNSYLKSVIRSRIIDDCSDNEMGRMKICDLYHYLVVCLYVQCQSIRTA